MTESTSYREAGEQALAAASEATREAEETEHAPVAQNDLTKASNHLLLAIYNEVRHGNDQQADALANLTAAVEMLTERLLAER